MTPEDLARLHQLQKNHPHGDVTVSWDQHGGFTFHLPSGRTIMAPSGIPPVRI